MCAVRCIRFLLFVIGLGIIVAQIIHLPPSRPSFTLHSIAPLDNDTITSNKNLTTTLTPQHWQVSFYLQNPDVRSFSSPAKRGAISYDRINAFLFLQGRDGGEVGVLYNVSTPTFRQKPGERTAMEVKFRSANKAVVIKDGVAKFTLQWSAKVRFHGTTDKSMKEGLVEAVCEDVNVRLLPDSAVIDGGDVKCLVGGTWLSFGHLATITWILMLLVLVC